MDDVRSAPRVDHDLVLSLYRRYTDDLTAAIAAQRDFLAAHPHVVPQLDDIEAEITYLLVRALRPRTVTEIGSLHGWSTTWLLRALADNGTGELHTFDRVPHACRSVPAELAAGRWTFHHGDARQLLGELPAGTGYLFVDADHGARFGRWYMANLLPRLASGTPVSVHDVFHGARARPFSEGRVITRWLARRGVPFHTAARRRAGSGYRAITALRAELGIRGARGTTRNPMIFFTLP